MSRARTVANFGDGLVTADLPTGSVLQVVEGSGSNTTYINSTSMTDIGLSVTITPTSTSSKIAVFVSASMAQDDNNGSFAFARLMRGSNELMEATVSQDPSTGQGRNSYSLQSLDSPSTTSATTYRVQGKTDNANSDFRPLASSSIIAMEIAG